MTDSLFLPKEDIAILTGRKTKSKQIEALRKMGVLFYVNASGHPVVPRSAIEGGKVAPQPKEWVMPRRWEPPK